jgi:phosphoribosyl-ATP pyrophosphohydrolase
MFQELFQIIQDRKQHRPEGSYTARLMEAGQDTILKKIGEEAVEVILAASRQGKQRLVEETADLFYHIFVLLSFSDISLDEVEDELRQRHQVEGK